MRYFVLFALISIATLRAAPIDEVRRQVNQVNSDLQAEIAKNDSLRKQVEQLAHQVQALQQEVNHIKEKSKKKFHKLRTRIVHLENAANTVLEVMPDLIPATEGSTISLSQKKFMHLVSLIPLQTITPNIELNAATYTIDISNILNALTTKLSNILNPS